MRILHVVGRKNHGKTTLVVELVRALTERGHRVGTIKHTSHVHELDTPGKDSHRHRLAGSAPAAIISNGQTAVYRDRGGEEDPYADILPHFSTCDLVLVEGDCYGPGTKIEVWRQENGTPLLASACSDIRAIVTDDPLIASLPVWPRRDLDELADRVTALIGLRATPREGWPRSRRERRGRIGLPCGDRR